MFHVSVTGCALADYLYKHVSFSSPAFRRALSVSDGDGGLAPGKLVFAEDLERFTGISYSRLRKELCPEEPDAFNLGGPAIVGAINAAQINYGRDIKFSFYGQRGDDLTGRRIAAIVEKTPVDISNYRVAAGASPCTDVLSDPEANEGKGERTFINTLGTVVNYGPADLGKDFFNADVLWFGATALTPGIHDSLTSLLQKGRDSDSFNVVSTVFDFRNEKRFPNGKWPLGESDLSYSMIDLLITDRDEALRLSGTRDIQDAAAFFIKNGVSAFLITYGAKNFYAWSSGELFRPLSLTSLPTCRLVDEELEAHPEKRGDTTGCGDNFAGGAVASMTSQLESGCSRGKLDLLDACAWGAASGGFACFYMGGTYLEKHPGEKREKLLPFYRFSAEQSN